MTLPNASHAAVDQGKVVAYLLNPAHPDGRGKAAFFEKLGFTARNWQAFAQALREVATIGSVAEEARSIHGTKYVVDGRIIGPEGAVAPVRTVWIVDRGTDKPRLVTAYPHGSEVR